MIEKVIVYRMAESEMDMIAIKSTNACQCAKNMIEQTTYVSILGRAKDQM